MPKEKLKLALYWAASCGGCEITMVELREKLRKLELAFMEGIDWGFTRHYELMACSLTVY